MATVAVIDPIERDVVSPEVYRERKIARGEVSNRGPQLILDWQPWERVISPVDGSLLTSRQDQREHCERNGVTPLGDHQGPTHTPDPGTPVKETVEKVVRGELGPVEGPKYNRPFDGRIYEDEGRL